MRRYRYEIDNVRAHLRSLWVVIGLQLLVILALWFGWSQAPKTLTVHVPPDLRSGAVLAVDEVPPANVYAFAIYIFQQLNRWPEDGARDYGKAIFRVSPYLTPRYRADLIADMDLKGRQGELAYRVRGVQEVPGHGYEEQRVDLLSKGIWVVWLDLDLDESVQGMTVKRTAIRYPIRVVHQAIDPEVNPWGLALDGFAGEGPRRLSEDEREDARMTRADRLLIRNALFRAAKQVKEQGRAQVITQDVVAALQQIGQDPTLPEHRRNRAIEMGDGMALFCSGLAGHFFNRPGNRWPEADVTILEMGILAREGYEDQLTVAYLSMMSHINDLVERCQHEARPTLVVTDEGHIITTNPLLARYVVKITKMWRKLGAWFWIATQNLEDFPDASRKMLNMMEWWLCLVMPKEEVEQIARFKELTEVQRSLLLSARKEPGKYVEGMVLSDNLEALFRNVPPPLSLALAMTEKHEKAERAGIMREHHCTELEAAYRVAERISGARA